MPTILFVFFFLVLSTVLLIFSIRFYYDVHKIKKNRKFIYTISFYTKMNEKYIYNLFSNSKKKEKKALLNDFFLIGNDQTSIKKDSRNYYLLSEFSEINVSCERQDFSDKKVDMLKRIISVTVLVFIGYTFYYYFQGINYNDLKGYLNSAWIGLLTWLVVFFISICIGCIVHKVVKKE